MDQAIQDGDLELTTFKGKDYLSFVSLKSGRMKSHKDETVLDAGKHEISASEHDSIDVWLRSLNVGTSAAAKGLENQESNTLVVLNKPKKELKWSEVEGILLEAKQAQGKLIRDSMKMKKRIVDSDDKHLIDKFKECLQVLQDNDRNLDHIMTWKAGHLGASGNVGSCGYGFCLHKYGTIGCMEFQPTFFFRKKQEQINIHELYIYIYLP